MRAFKLSALGLALGMALASASAAVTPGDERPPELDPVKWYNTPPLALEQLQGKAVLVEVFRTW